MSDQRIGAEFREVTSDGPVLHFFIPNTRLLAELIGVFRRLGEGAAVISLAECRFADLKNVRNITLECIGDLKEPARRLQADKHNQVFRWVHDKAGWCLAPNWLSDYAPAPINTSTTAKATRSGYKRPS